jgi:hypothetical protein
VTLSLFEADDNPTPKVRDMTVGPVSTEDVDLLCRRYHYTATGGSATWRWGLWDGPFLMGVVAYNMPTPRTSYSVFGKEYGAAHIWHMGRLVLPDSAPRNSESRLIGGSLRCIEREHPEAWAVVTFADAGSGHIGTVYQATNALYTGTGGRPEFYLDAQGRHRSFRQNGSTITASDAASRGWTRHRGGLKHRYVYILGNRTQRRERLRLLRLPVLPYPKQQSDEVKSA